MRHRLRYWAGQDWSAWVADDTPEVATDPLDATEHYLAPGTAIEIVATRVIRPPVGHPPRRTAPIIYGIYAGVFSLVGITVLVNEPGQVSFDMFMLGAAPVFLVPLILVLARATSAAPAGLTLGLVASVAVPVVAHALFFAGHDWSSSDLAVLFVLWAATLVAVAYATRLVARRTGRRAQGSTSASLTLEGDVQDVCHCDALTGALFGAHLGAIFLGLALMLELGHMGPVRHSYLFGVYLGDYWPHPGDWRLEIPVALVAMLAVSAGVAIDLVRLRGWPSSSAAVLGDVAFALLAIIAIATTVGLLAAWWPVVHAGGEASSASLAVVPVYLLGLAVIVSDWRSQRAVDTAAHTGATTP